LKNEDGRFDGENEGRERERESASRGECEAMHRQTDRMMERRRERTQIMET
jgi:hypothetical protein